MLLQMKQLDNPDFEVWYREFMSVKFPTVISANMIWPTGDGKFYPHQADSDGNIVINIDKGVALDVNKLPQKAKLVYKNAPEGEVDLFWVESKLNYNPKKSGQQVLRGELPTGIYNPNDIHGEIFVNVSLVEKMSLSNWWGSGATVNGTSYKEAKTAEEFDVLTDYYITNLWRAFKGASNVVSLPDIETDPAIAISNGTFESVFEDCASLVKAPKISGIEKATVLISTFKNCKSLSDVSDLNIEDVTSLSSTFYGCSSLTKLPSLGKLTSATSAFCGCTSLPEVIPDIIKFSSMSQSGITNMFKDTNVKEITIQYDGETIPTFINPYYMGGQLEKITIVDSEGNVRAVKTVADNPTEFTYTSPGTYTFTVPSNVTKAKVALVSGADYKAVSHGEEYISATNKVSTIKDSAGNIVASSYTSGKISEDLVYVGGRQNAVGGLPCKFDATYGDYNSGKVYACGVSVYVNKNVISNPQPMAGCTGLENSFVQKEISLTPGETYTINVAAGGTSNSGFTPSNWNRQPTNGTYGGYVIISTANQE